MEDREVPAPDCRVEVVALVAVDPELAEEVEDENSWGKKIR